MVTSFNPVEKFRAEEETSQRQLLSMIKSFENIAASLITLLKAKMVLLVQILYLVSPNKYISPLPHKPLGWDFMRQLCVHEVYSKIISLLVFSGSNQKAEEV